MKRARVVVLVLGVSLALPGCAQGPAGPAPGAVGEAPSPSPQGPESSPAVEPHNEADVAFAQGMIPHHRQAVEMSQLASERASDPDVRALAERIRAAQDPEIDTMSAWLRTWGAEVPEPGAVHAHGGADMPGMLTAEQMAELAGASGEEFDRSFLAGMIEHHQGALDMAREEQAEGRSPAARELARVIEAEQQAEIDVMRELLRG